MQPWVQAYGFGLLVAVTAACQQSTPGGIEGTSCSRSGDTTSNHGGCCTCGEDKTWQCTKHECSSRIITPPGEPSQDRRLMGDGTSNRTGLGGYWWTYVDRSERSQIVPYTGKIDPNDNITVSPPLARQIGVGWGIDDGAYHVRGYVGDAPAYNSEKEEDQDLYWDGYYALYPETNGVPNPFNSCTGGTCGELRHPMAGLAFGFKSRSAPLGADAADKVGVAFKMKLGATHGLDEHAKPFPVSIELPLDLTDAPDPTLDEQFGSAYAGLDSAHADLGSPNLPLCSFATSLDAQGVEVGRAQKTCFYHPTTQGKTALALTTEWQTFCLVWDAFGVPPYAPASLQELSVVEQRARLIKVQFEAYKPATNSMDSAPFDFYVDDVWLLDQAKWDEICASAVTP